MTDKDLTAQELMKEFGRMLDGELSDYSRSTQIGPKLKEVASKYIEERVYDSNKHAKLGMHVEAVMKHFKGL